MTATLYPRSRPARALIRIARQDEAGRPLGAGRELVYYGGRGKGRGTCSWCGEPADTPRREWHDECLRWYACARGLVKDYKGWPLFASTAEINGFLDRKSAWREANPLPDDGDYWVHWAKCPERLAVCEECGGGYQQIDHRLALSVAQEMRAAGMRGWWKAWAPANLRPICQACHGPKTGTDRRTRNRLRAERMGQGVQEEIKL